MITVSTRLVGVGDPSPIAARLGNSERLERSFQEEVVQA